MVVRMTLILLVLCNLGYFFWQIQQPPKEEGNEIERRRWGGSEQASIQLLDEAIESGLAIAHDEKDRPSQAADLELCTRIGAFSTQESAQAVQNRLIALSIKSDLGKETAFESSSYLVYIPSLENKVAAVRLANVLKAKSIDSFVITEKGSLENAISLGLFGRRNQAEEFMNMRIKEGYDVRIRENQHTRVDDYWLMLNGDNSGLLGEALWIDLQSRYPSLKKVNELCDESIASPGELP